MVVLKLIFNSSYELTTISSTAVNLNTVQQQAVLQNIPRLLAVFNLSSDTFLDLFPYNTKKITVQDRTAETCSLTFTFEYLFVLLLHITPFP